VQNGKGHYLVVLTLADTDYVCEYIRKGGDRQAFLKYFEGCHSEGFDPDIHLRRVGVANQTTMMRGETEEVQRRIEAAMRDRDGEVKARESFRLFRHHLRRHSGASGCAPRHARSADEPAHRVGGYNSSNTSHLAEMGEAALPTYFIRNASRMESRDRIVHYDLHKKQEVTTETWLPSTPLVVGITAGASCPNNLIEEAIVRLFELHGIDRERLLAHT
jgi:4-hydroxy-3-methylbut-2-enyl diphosphate reductase